MFHTKPVTSDRLEGCESKDSELDQISGKDASADSIHSDPEAAERQSGADEVEEHEDELAEKTPPRPSKELKRTTSNALSRISSRLTTHSLPDPGPPPDGGLKAWTQIAMGWIAIFTTWGWINCFGVFQTYYTLHLDGVSPSDISWIGTVQNFMTFILGAVSGRLLDAGYFLPTVAVGVVMQLLGIFMMSLSTKYWQFLLTQGILYGIGGGLVFTPCMGVMATWFSKHRSFAMGCASTGNSIGGMVYPIIVRELLPKLGFAWTVRVLGFLNMFLLCLILVFMRPRLPPRPSQALVDWDAFKEAPFALFCFGLAFQCFNIYFTLYYVAPYGVQELGLPFNKSTILVIIINGIGVPARLIPGYVADKIGQLNLLGPISCALAIISWSWLAVHNIAGLYTFVCFYGILVAALQCLFPPTVAALTLDLRVIGTRMGMTFSMMGISALVGPPIGGAIISASGYTGAQAWAAACGSICAVAFFAARVKKVGWKIRLKA